MTQNCECHSIYYSGALCGECVKQLRALARDAIDEVRRNVDAEGVREEQYHELEKRWKELPQ